MRSLLLRSRSTASKITEHTACEVIRGLLKDISKIDGGIYKHETLTRPLALVFLGMLLRWDWHVFDWKQNQCL